MLHETNHPLPTFDQVIGHAERYVDEVWRRVGADIDDMEDRYKRFILYYYVATQIFEWQERTTMPVCVRVAIRSMHPNRRGVVYSDRDTYPPAADDADGDDE